VSIAVVGKYAEHRDAYKSIYESIDHAGMANSSQVRIARIKSEELEAEGPERMLAGYDGILVPGRFRRARHRRKDRGDSLRPREGRSRSSASASACSAR
jgi:CTP synthase (UTP-ammonia lyase)